jgi:hypothetical protein
MAWARQGRTGKQQTLPPTAICESIHASELVLGELVNPIDLSKLTSEESTPSVDTSDEILTPKQDDSNETISPVTSLETFDFVDFDLIKFDEAFSPDPSSPAFSVVDISLLLLACDAPLLAPISSSGSSITTIDDWRCDKIITQL